MTKSMKVKQGLSMSSIPAVQVVRGRVRVRVAEEGTRNVKGCVEDGREKMIVKKPNALCRAGSCIVRSRRGVGNVVVGRVVAL